MKHDVQQEMELRRYLLGELPLEEQVLVEQRLFLDSEYAELQQAVEDDLIDEYLTDELTGSEREKFEKHFLLLPEHGADLKIAQALKKYLSNGGDPSPATGTNNTPDDQPSPIPPFSFFNKPMVWLSLTVAVLIVLSITWIAFRFTRGPTADAPLEAGNPQPANTRPEDKQQPAPVPRNENRVQTAEKGKTNGASVKPKTSGKPQERRSAPAQATVSYVLTAGNPSRGIGSRNTVRIYADTKEVLLRLPLEFSESYEKYRAELLSGERRIDEWSDLKSQPDEKFGSVVSVTVSANLLREQSYRIRLHSVPADQQSAELPTIYPFNVERK